jgi:ribosome-binding ATPase YchF (GTP1/OBG family)
MKISAIGLPELNPGKHNIKDSRLDEVDSITKAKKKTYVQVEVVPEEDSIDADAILVVKDSASDLILKDLEFVETRLSRATEEAEKNLFNKLKGILEKEEFISRAALSADEKKELVKYGLLTAKPVIVADGKDMEDKNALLSRALKESGFISFFTTGEKDTRAWLIRCGANAWEASGAIHSDIQQGFIRAEIIPFKDFMECGGENQAKQAGKMRLEPKEYIMQDCDLANFRFNK